MTALRKRKSQQRIYSAATAAANLLPVSKGMARAVSVLAGSGMAKGLETPTSIAPASTEVKVRVDAVLAPLHQAVVIAEDGRQFSITRKTPGLSVDELVEGQRLMCRIAVDLPKVLEARVLA